MSSSTENIHFLIYGGNGWIGSKVYNELIRMDINVDKSECRADDVSSIEAEIKNPKYTHVMSFIGRTHGVYQGETISTIDYLEKPGKLVENVRDNLYAPVVLASFCKTHGKHFTYLGTGCIFDYDEEHPFGDEHSGFKESDKPNFFGSSYSTVKGFTDRLMHDLFNDSALNVRIRMPITSEINPRNFICKIVNYEKICSIPNSMTVLDNLIPVMISFALQKKTGTVNMTNPGLISHNEILEMYKEYIDCNFTWKNFTIEEQNEILASKRSNNCLDTHELANVEGVKPIKEAVRDILIKMLLEEDHDNDIACEIEFIEQKC
jgi:3,5-epimerase/4-reductase